MQTLDMFMYHLHVPDSVKYKKCQYKKIRKKVLTCTYPFPVTCLP